MTRRSLQTFVDISMHPRIGPQVQVVTLTPLCTFPKALPVLVPPNSLIHQENGSGKIRAYTKMVHHYLNRADEETELKNSGETRELLIAAFESLKEYDRHLCLCISDYEENTKRTHVGA